MDGDRLTVHEFEPRKGVGTTFLPLWIKGKKRERKADKPAGFAAEEMEIAVAKLVCSVELDGNWKWTEASDNYSRPFPRSRSKTRSRDPEKNALVLLPEQRHQ